MAIPCATCETHNAAFLQHAEHIAAFILQHPNLPADKVPYWDFNAPGIPNEPGMLPPRQYSPRAFMNSAPIVKMEKHTAKRRIK